MWSGAIFRSGVGHVVDALSEAELYAFAPGSTERLPVGCGKILSDAGRTVVVLGPAIEDEARVVHGGF